MKVIDQFFESFRPVPQFLVTCTMGLIAHLDIVASVLAVIVLLFQLKVVVLNGRVKDMELKLKQIELEKERQGQSD